MNRKQLILWLILASAAQAGFCKSPQEACLGALQRDTFEYAAQHHLDEAALWTVTKDTFEQAKHSLKLLVGLPDILTGSLDYGDFSKKRSHYFEQRRFNLTQDDAVRIVSHSIGVRSYQAYSQCLRTTATSGMSAWVERETPTEVEVHVIYRNPTGIARKLLVGTVTGGHVPGQRPGEFLRHRFGINEAEHTIVVKRSPGEPITGLAITAPDDHSTSWSEAHPHADGMLFTDFVGYNDVLVGRASSDPMLQTPNNNENRGSCPNMVDHRDGKYCTSRTHVRLSVPAPYVLGGAEVRVSGSAAPWSEAGLVNYEQGGQTAVSYVDNWGSPVGVSLVANKYERFSGERCGVPVPQPIVMGQPVRVQVSDSCAPIAVVKVDVGDGAQHQVPFGKMPASSARLTMGDVVKTPQATVVSYTLKRPEQAVAVHARR